MSAAREIEYFVLFDQDIIDLFDATVPNVMSLGTDGGYGKFWTTPEFHTFYAMMNDDVLARALDKYCVIKTTTNKTLTITEFVNRIHKLKIT